MRGCTITGIDLTPKPAPRPLTWPQIVNHIRGALAGFLSPVYIVGGAVRDAIIGRPLHDIDLATGGNALRAARMIADALEGAYYPLDRERGVGRALVDSETGRITVDVARFRGPDLASDLLGRDFTINAMAVPLYGDDSSVIDPLGGLDDLRAGILRQCSPDSIAQDPIRAIRAVRQSAELGFTIEPETRKAAREFGPAIKNTSAERVRDEFSILLGGPSPARALRALDLLGLLEIIVPEVKPMHGAEQSHPHTRDVWGHTLDVVDVLDKILHVIGPERTESTAASLGLGMIVFHLDRYRADLQKYLAKKWPEGRTTRSLLMLAALLHDAGKPETSHVDETGRIRFFGHERVGARLAWERATAMRLSRNEIGHLAAIVRHHMRPLLLAKLPKISARAVYRFIRDAGKATPGICILALADHLACMGPRLDPAEWGHFLETVSALLDGWFRRREQMQPRPLLSGDEICDLLGIKPGPQIGRLLEKLREAQAAGEVTDRDQAVELVRKAYSEDSQQKSGQSSS